MSPLLAFRRLRVLALLVAALHVGAGAAPLAAQSPVRPATTALPDADVSALPLVEVPVTAAPVGTPGTSPLAQRSVAVLMTGDGNWAPIDRGIASALAEGGVPVVGLKAREYLEHGGRRTPEGLALDVARIARAYQARWNRDRIILLGFSRGADFVPLVVNRLAPDVRERVVLAGMYGAEDNASFEFHLLDLFSDAHRATDIPVAPELTRMVAGSPGLRAFCVYGEDEKNSVCKQVAGAPSLRRIARGGAHHFDKDYPGLGRLALEELAR